MRSLRKWATVAAFVGVAAVVFGAASGRAAAVEDATKPSAFPAGSFILGGGPEPATFKDKADVRDPFNLPPGLYLLSGGPKPTDLLVVDDDLEVLVGDAKLFVDDDHWTTREIGAEVGREGPGYDGAPIILRLPRGMNFQIRATKQGSPQGALGELWLHRFDGSKRRLTKGLREPANAPAANVFFDEKFKIEEGWDAPAPAAAAPGDKELADLWERMAKRDEPVAYFAVWGMAAAPEQAVPFLREHVKPAAVGEEDKLIQKLIGQLDDDALAVRDQAQRELAKLGPAADSALRRARKADPGAEVARRLDELLRPLEDALPPVEQVRAWRSMDALERMATPDAKKLLEVVAAGLPGDPLTDRALQSLERLKKREGR